MGNIFVNYDSTPKLLGILQKSCNEWYLHDMTEKGIIIELII